MEEDYNSRSFNSYVSGPGVMMESSRRVGGTGSSTRPSNIALFVDNIPTSLTKVGLCVGACRGVGRCSNSSGVFVNVYLLT